MTSRQALVSPTRLKIIYRVFGRTPPEGLLCFSLKNGSSYKTSGRAPPDEPEPEPGRNPTKQGLNFARLPTASVGCHISFHDLPLGSI